MKKILCLFLALALLFTSCEKEKKAPVYFDSEDSEELLEEEYAQSGDEIVVPFREEGGVKYVAVKVNGVGWDMIFDTGCSGTLISIAEANYLYQKGLLTSDDILGASQSMIADGSIVENMVVRLAEVVIDDMVRCKDVTATVSANVNAPLLLGNEVWNRLATVTIDNENQTLNLKLK